MYSTVQYSTVQYSTVQYSTVQYSTVHRVWNKCYIKLPVVCTLLCLVIRVDTSWIDMEYSIDALLIM